MEIAEKEGGWPHFDTDMLNFFFFFFFFFSSAAKITVRLIGKIDMHIPAMVELREQVCPRRKKGEGNAITFSFF